MTVLAFVIGLFVGTGWITAYWLYRVQQPKVAIEMLKYAYRMSHPHWTQVSQDDATLVCPCCGWSEERAEEARGVTRLTDLHHPPGGVN